MKLEGRHEGSVRGYYIHRPNFMNEDEYESWEQAMRRLGKEPDQTRSHLLIGVYRVDGGGTTGEFAIRWHDTGIGRKPARLEIFNDAWDVMNYFSDLFQLLKMFDWGDLRVGQQYPKSREPTLENIVCLLDELGIKNLTRPY